MKREEEKINITSQSSSTITYSASSVAFLPPDTEGKSPFVVFAIKNKLYVWDSDSDSSQGSGDLIKDIILLSLSDNTNETKRIVTLSQEGKLALWKWSNKTRALPEQKRLDVPLPSAWRILATLAWPQKNCIFLITKDGQVSELAFSITDNEVRWRKGTAKFSSAPLSAITTWENRYFATYTEDGLLQVWEVNWCVQGQSPGGVLWTPSLKYEFKNVDHDSTSPIKHIAVAPQYFITGSEDGEICLWDRKNTSTPDKLILERELDRISSIAVVGKYLVVAARRKMRIWDLDTKELLGSGITSRESVQKLIPLGRLHFLTASSAILRVWNVAEQKQKAIFHVDDLNAMRAWLVMPDEHTIAVADQTGQVHFLRWRSSSG